MTLLVTTPTGQPAIVHVRWWERFGGTRLSGTSGGPKAKTMGLVAGAVVLWASWPALATAVGPAPPFLTLGASALIGFLFSLSLAARKGASRIFLSLPLRTMVFVSLGLMGNNAFYIAAIARIGPAEANVVHYLWPVFLVLLASMLHRRLPSLFQALGIACGFLGVAVALYPQMAGNLDGVGVLLGVCGAMTFAVYSVGRSIARVETNVVGPSLGLAGLAALCAHFILEPAYWPSTPEWLAIIFMGIGPFTVANMLWDKATRSGSAAAISSFAFLTPLVAMGLLATFGLGNVTLNTIVGALLAIAGALLSSTSKRGSSSARGSRQD
ncbi:DMT family transporter [uncultured Roseibium sp.]|uniref:DMT family transporter n=1 Tax=uncultured Roseibium sp. TaxID=1936171 RepID=UPI00263535C7|nr:DMT family transporter [uncultured Roseibium sp.]